MIVAHSGPDQRREIEGAGPITERTLQRLACDANIVRVIDGEYGEPLSVGRRTRIIPRPMSRALRFRDRGCRFPGCTATRVDAHHIKHWADGGETSLANLLLLCRRHHRLVHEHGFHVDGKAAFSRPEGRPLTVLAANVDGPIGSRETDAHTCRTRSYTRGVDYGTAVGALMDKAG